MAVRFDALHLSAIGLVYASVGESTPVDKGPAATKAAELLREAGPDTTFRLEGMGYTWYACSRDAWLRRLAAFGVDVPALPRR